MNLNQMHWLLESNIDLFQKSCRVIASRCDELEIVVCRNNTFKLAAKYSPALWVVPVVEK